MAILKHKESGELFRVSAVPVWAFGIWDCGSMRFVDLHGTDYAPLPAVSPVQFQLLWTSAERLAIEPFRQTNQALQDFYKILDDPRLTEVELGLQSTQDAINYTIHLIAASMQPAYGEADIERRLDEILSGQIK